MAVLTEERRHKIGEVKNGWRLLSIDYKTQKAIIECEHCSLTKEVSSAGYYNSSFARCLCSGLVLFNHEPVICTTDVQKQTVEMLNMGDSYGDVGERLGISRQAVGSTVKSIRNNYQKYLKQLQKSNDLKANRE